MKLQTPVDINPIDSMISYRNSILFMGSCFASDIGGIMQNLGFDVLLNPFGVLYNPASIASAVDRLKTNSHFDENDVIHTDGWFSSFHHHSSFSRQSPDSFLTDANNALDVASEKFRAADTCIITLGTAWVFRHISKNIIVSNCHKIPAKEFQRFKLEVSEITEILSTMVRQNMDKIWIFTVSPIRHLSDGAHGNQLSKASLLLAIDNLSSTFSNVHYFPAYEIMMDELRDYRFYCDDMTHPTSLAINHIFEKFSEFAIDSNEKDNMLSAMKAYKASCHRPIKQSH